MPFPPDVPIAECQRIRIERVLSQDNPMVNPNRLLMAKVLESGPLAGQLQVQFTQELPRGMLIPYVGEIKVDDGVDSMYAFSFQFRNKQLVIYPDYDTAAPYANDFCGPDRSNATQHEHKLNLKFTIVPDTYGRPYVFFQTTRAVKKGEVGLTDYGDMYWKRWTSKLDALSPRSQLCGSVSTVLAITRGCCPGNPFEITGSKVNDLDARALAAPRALVAGRVAEADEAVAQHEEALAQVEADRRARAERCVAAVSKAEPEAEALPANRADNGGGGGGGADPTISEPLLKDCDSSPPMCIARGVAVGAQETCELLTGQHDGADAGGEGAAAAEDEDDFLSLLETDEGKRPPERFVRELLGDGEQDEPAPGDEEKEDGEEVETEEEEEQEDDDGDESFQGDEEEEKEEKKAEETVKGEEDDDDGEDAGRTPGRRRRRQRRQSGDSGSTTANTSEAQSRPQQAAVSQHRVQQADRGRKKRRLKRRLLDEDSAYDGPNPGPIC